MPGLHLHIGLAGAVLLLPLNEAIAHGFAGARFFPATLASDDPFVADEFSLPTAAFFKDSDDVRTESYSVDLAKRITRDFGIELGESYVSSHVPGGPTASGFDNLSFGAKYQIAIDPVHEAIFAVGVDADIGGTGAKRIGADRFSTFTPTFFFGKGFGDLSNNVSLLRPFAVTGSMGVALPTKENPDALEIGLALEYSLQYLQSQVRDVGLGAPFDRLIPLVEFAVETPFQRGGVTTGTANPGVVWAGQYFQLGAEAIIPLNGASGHVVGFKAQLHFFIDDLFPNSIGRPIFGG
ncbi:MAG TPA: hypothetical protein VEU06_09700 [Micropepsaceae bacterium]|nr:hypothetical protein [Micropepsaceae bacterium]